MIAARVVPARPCPLGHTPTAWLDRDGDARCLACRPPALAPDHAGLPAGVARKDAQDAAERVQYLFLRLLWPEFTHDRVPHGPPPKKGSAWLVGPQLTTTEVTS